MKKDNMLKLGGLAAVVIAEVILIACFGEKSSDGGWLRLAEMIAGVLFGVVGVHAAFSLWRRSRNDDEAQEMTLRLQDERGLLIASKVNALVGTAALLGLALMEMTAAAMDNRLFTVMGLVILLCCAAVKFGARAYYEKQL